MSKTQVEQKVKEILADHLGLNIADVELDKNIVLDLGADELDSVEIIMTCEETFGLSVTEDEAEKTDTVRQLVDLVCKKINAI